MSRSRSGTPAAPSLSSSARSEPDSGMRDLASRSDVGHDDARQASHNTMAHEQEERGVPTRFARLEESKEGRVTRGEGRERDDGGDDKDDDAQPGDDRERASPSPPAAAVGGASVGETETGAVEEDERGGVAADEQLSSDAAAPAPAPVAAPRTSGERATTKSGSSSSSEEDEERMAESSRRLAQSTVLPAKRTSAPAVHRTTAAPARVSEVLPSPSASSSSSSSSLSPARAERREGAQQQRLRSSSPFNKRSLGALGSSQQQSPLRGGRPAPGSRFTLAHSMFAGVMGAGSTAAVRARSSESLGPRGASAAMGKDDGDDVAAADARFESFMGPRQSFMQVINMLANEEDEHASSSADEGSAVHRQRAAAHGDSSAGHAAHRVPLPDSTASLSSRSSQVGSRQLDSSSSSEGTRDPRAKQDVDAHSSSHEARLSPRDLAEGEDTSQEQSRSSASPPGKPRPLEDDFAGGFHSTINAIYRPIAARQRTRTGDSTGERVAPEGDAYVRPSAEEPVQGLFDEPSEPPLQAEREADDYFAAPSPAPEREDHGDSDAGAEGDNEAESDAPPDTARPLDQHQQLQHLHGNLSGSQLSKRTIISPRRRSTSVHSTRTTKTLNQQQGDDEAAEQQQRQQQQPRLRRRYSSQVSAKTTTTAAGRRARLADKLAEIFGIESLANEQVYSEWPCWMFRSVLLQGYMFLTSGHICFYAYLHHEKNAVIRSGNLSAKARKTRRYNRHWFVLRDHVLTWYPNSSEPYFPDGHIDLHYCTAVETSRKHDTHFKVLTADKKWHFAADSKVSRDEWVKTLQKAVFRCQNEGGSVKIAIPWETVVDVDRSTDLEFAETIRVRVYDHDEAITMDEYWLSYFSDLDAALQEMQMLLRDWRSSHADSHGATVRDSTLQRKIRTPADALVDAPPDRKEQTGGIVGVATGTAMGAATGAVNVAGNTFSRLSKLGGALPAGLQRVATPRSRSRSNSRSASGSPAPEKSERTDSPLREGSDIGSGQEDPDHTYPPDPAPGARPTSSQSKWTVPGLPGVPGLPNVGAWVRGGPRGKVTEVITPAPRDDPQKEEHEQRRESAALDSAEDDDKRADVDAKFQMVFGLAHTEHVLYRSVAYLFRGLPLYGKIYVSQSYVCYRSTGPLTSTKMVLPLADIISVEKQRSYTLGYSGLCIVIKGYEEVFIEFSSAEKRDKCMRVLRAELEAYDDLHAGEGEGERSGQRQMRDLIDLSLSRSSASSDQSRPAPESGMSSTQLPIMFSSTTSDFVTFRPEHSMRVTCLTIGSRGDVQPYIALCKALKAHGHTCRIATHPEYKDWVEGHGMDFEPVGGDPGDLMQLMIAHDFFTIAFMREAITKFRGWLDDLLESSWRACQGSDLLIESPSAIAGIHIAEGLRIPYYRAFTMPWTRTRAYPHAFAVPEVKMGGSYNYMTYTMFDQVFWRATAAQINRWRRKVLNIGPTSLEAMHQHRIPFLYNFSPAIVPPPLDWRENVHVTGYWWLDNPDDSESSKWEPPAELVSFLDNAKSKGKHVVFLGFGSIIIPDPEELSRVVTQAIENAGVHAIIAKGWSDRASSKNASAEEQREAEEQEDRHRDIMSKDFIYTVKTIPHDWLFPRVSAAVHHGGAGTTGASLRAGLPTIIKPFFGDQYFWAERVSSLGIGTALRQLDVDSLTEALITAVTDEKQIARAQKVGEQVRSDNGIATAIECIYRDLEYARSLIPPAPDSQASKEQAEEQDEEPTRRLETPTQADRSGFFSSEFSSPQMLSHAAQMPDDARATSSDESWDVLSHGSGSERRRGSTSRDASRSHSRGGRETATDDDGAHEPERRGLFGAVRSKIASAARP